MATNKTSDSTFQDDISSQSNLVLVDFWAEWCGPCKQISPILEEIANEKENLNILKLNIDENPATPQKYNVRGIPTLMLFKDGKLIDTKIGSLPKSSLEDWINSYL
jgi:thioredoxin 1|tara:strand:- start:1053 stop:1370 length:318 start_codon:yes stop_codon:yes gene_type:complete